MGGRSISIGDKTGNTINEGTNDGLICKEFVVLNQNGQKLKSYLPVLYIRKHRPNKTNWNTNFDWVERYTHPRQTSKSYNIL